MNNYPPPACDLINFNTPMYWLEVYCSKTDRGQTIDLFVLFFDRRFIIKVFFFFLLLSRYITTVFLIKNRILISALSKPRVLRGTSITHKTFTNTGTWLRTRWAALLILSGDYFFEIFNRDSKYLERVCSGAVLPVGIEWNTRYKPRRTLLRGPIDDTYASF